MGVVAALPWEVEARSPSGRTLLAMVVRQGDVIQTAVPEGELWSAPTERITLACGRLAMWAGFQMEGPYRYRPPLDDCR